MNPVDVKGHFEVWEAVTTMYKQEARFWAG